MLRLVPWWAVLSAVLAPVLLVGGWTLAAAVQPAGYDPVRDTISALAGHGATHRWIMTAGLVGVGVCHIVTASGLGPAVLAGPGRPGPAVLAGPGRPGPASPAGRVVLAIGGAATLGVAAAPLPSSGGSVPHGIAAAVAFAALAGWPLLAMGRGRTTPLILRPAASIAAAAVLLGVLAWFVVELFGDGARIGASERATAGAQAVWPLVVVLAVRWRPERARDGAS